MAEDRKKDSKATQNEPPEASKPVDGPKATEPDQKSTHQGAAGEGAAPHDD